MNGKDFLSLDINLPLDELRDPIRESLSEDGKVAETTVDAVTRRGRSFQCWVRVLPLRSTDGEPYGAILLMADRELSAELAPTA